MDRIAQVAKTWDEQLDALGHGDKWEKRFKALAKQGRESLGELDTLLEGLTHSSAPTEREPSMPPVQLPRSEPAPPSELAATSAAPQLYEAPPESWFPLSDALEPESDPVPAVEELVPVSDVPTAFASAAMQDEAASLADMLEPESEQAPSDVALDAQRTTLIEDPEAAEEADRSYEEFLKSLEVDESLAMVKPVAPASFRIAPPPPPPPPAPPPKPATDAPEAEQSIEEPEFDSDQDRTACGTDFDDESHEEFHTKVATSDSIMAALKKVAEEQGAATNSILLRSIRPEPTDQAEVDEDVFLLDEDMEADADTDNLTDVEAQSEQSSGWPEDTQADPDSEKTESDALEPEKKGFFKRLFKTKG